jgi:putative membrane protein
MELRGRLPDSIDEAVEENRFTISVIFPFIGAFLFLASFESLLPGFLSFNPLMILFGTLVMRLPLIAGLKPLATRKFLFGLGLLTFYSYLIEFVGIETGFPYGSFSYGIELGPMILGKVPLALPLFFIPLVVNSYLLTLLLFPQRCRKPVYRITFTIGLVILVDLVLDPAAVAINFWDYGGGIYYGVPLTNYLGWIMSSTVAVLIIDKTVNRTALVERIVNCEFFLDDMVSFVLLWGLINLYFLNLIAVIMTGFLLIPLIKSGRFNFAGTNEILSYLGLLKE